MSLDHPTTVIGDLEPGVNLSVPECHTFIVHASVLIYSLLVERQQTTPNRACGVCTDANGVGVPISLDNPGIGIKEHAACDSVYKSFIAS